MVLTIVEENEALAGRVVKRDGSVEELSTLKIESSIRKAVEGLRISEEELDDVVSSVISEVKKKASEGPISTSTIADIVERNMIEKIIENTEWEEAAKRYAMARIYNHVYGKGGWSEFNSVDLELAYNSIKVLEARYLLKDPETLRYRETPLQLFRRVARHLASIERNYGKPEEEVRKWEEEFFRILSERRFMPNSPTLMNAGTRLGVLSACFVIPVRDALSTPDGEGIMDAVRAQALIFQAGGGVGADFSEIRPEGDVVSSSGGKASGPLSFMRLFDVNTEVIKQGGKRRGANMGILHVWHPDIEKFIRAKSGELKDTHLQNFNISVAVYDEFMEAAEKGDDWPLINPRKTALRKGKGYDSRYYAIVRARHSLREKWVQEVIIRELEERGGSVPLDESLIITLDEAFTIAENEDAVVRRVEAAHLLDMIVDSAWDSGDPGMIFIDEINRRHPVWYLGKVQSTNPCVSGDTRVLTPQGWIKASELFAKAKKTRIAMAVAADGGVLGEGGEPTAYPVRLVVPGPEVEVYRTVHGASLSLNAPLVVDAWVWHVGKKKGLRVRTGEGYEVTVTPEHRFLTPEGWKEARELRPGDKVFLARLHPGHVGYAISDAIDLDEDIAFALGWLVGDGTFSKHYVAWYFSPEDREAYERVKKAILKLGGNPEAHHVDQGSTVRIQFNNSTTVYKRILKLSGDVLEKSRYRRLPEVVWRLSPNSLAAFLRALFTADGYVDMDRAIRLTSASPEMLKEVQQLLLIFGIQSRIYRRPYKSEFSYTTKSGEERTYKTVEYHELVIPGYSRLLFAETIGFESRRKMEKLSLKKTKRDARWATVERVEDAGFVDFYDFTVPGIHAYIAGGLVHHNCGEQPLLPWESCNLGSINLEKYVVRTSNGYGVDWEGLARDVRVAVRFLDNVIDANKHPLPQITEANLRTRKVGLGVMGWARFLVRLGVKYDSPEAIHLAWRVAEWIAYNAYLASVELAREKGAFPAWNSKLYRFLWKTLRFKSPEEVLREAGLPTEVGDEHVAKLLEEAPRPDWRRVEEAVRKYGLRNAALLSIAPTGSISIIAGTSSSIEPLFALAFMRMVSVGRFIEVDKLFLEYLKRYELDDPEVIREIAKTGTIAHIPFMPRTIKKIFRTAHDIDPPWHVVHQAVWQQWIDAAVSKTINLRHDEPPETVKRVYMLAWRLGCKGITIYRDKSKSRQVIYFGIKKEKERAKKLEEQGVQAQQAQGAEPRRVMSAAEHGVTPLQTTPLEPPRTGGGGEGNVLKLQPKKKFRIAKEDYVTVAENFAGGCPTCDV